MFIGEFQHNADAKGRLMIPTAFREALGDKFYALKGNDNCIRLFASSEWEELSSDFFDEKIIQSFGKKGLMGLQRFLYSSAAELNFDKQGRILLPANLRNYAGIEKEVYILGVGRFIEIWSKDKWEIYQNEDDFNFDAFEDTIQYLNVPDGK